MHQSLVPDAEVEPDTPPPLGGLLPAAPAGCVVVVVHGNVHAGYG